MARKADQKAVTAKMYRHFAVVTLIATAALAMAADDGNSDKLNAEVAAKQAKLVAAGSDIKKSNQTTVIKRSGKPAPAASGWGSDEGGGGGSSGGGTSASSSYVPQGIGGKGVTVGMLRQLKLTPAQFMAMSAEEQAKVMDRLNGGDGEKQMSQAQQARVQQSVASASLARSGFQGPCNDC